MKIKNIILEVIIFIFYYSVFHKLIEFIPIEGVLGNFFFLVLLAIGLIPCVALADRTYKYVTNNMISKERKCLVFGCGILGVCVVFMIMKICC